MHSLHLPSTLHKAVIRPRVRGTTALHCTASTGTQVYTINGKPLTVPLAAVQQLPEPLQAATFGAIFAALGLGTYATCTAISPAIASVAPDAFNFSLGVVGPVFSLIYGASGVLHLLPAGHEDFVSMYPKQGAWGIWYLPGSPSFHVNWTGVAEILGAAGMVLGAIPPVADAVPALQPAAAMGLFLLTLAITPANIYMFTHNAPGPGPKSGEPIPAAGHVGRLVLQVFLLATFWGLAHR